MAGVVDDISTTFDGNRVAVRTRPSLPVIELGRLDTAARTGVRPSAAVQQGDGGTQDVARRRSGGRPEDTAARDGGAGPRDIAAGDRARLDAIAARILAEEPALGDTAMFGEAVRPGLSESGPALCIEDHSALELHAGRGITVVEYRALLLAGDGDFLAVGHRREPAFEDYCRDTLGLGRVETLIPAADERAPMRLAQRLLQDPGSIGRLAAAARHHGVLSLVPYYSNGGSWLLAREIAARSGAAVRVGGPMPRLARRVNDKLWFADLVAELLGRRARPMTYYAYGPAALAGQLQRLARRHERLIVKIPGSAGSLGNLAIASEELLARPLGELHGWLIETLTGLRWEGGWPLLVGVWDSPAIGSPSVQAWIPEVADGPPVIEGIFDQMVQGARGVFTGAAPADLPAELAGRIAHEAALLAGLLQRLGYYGRCSFDTVLAGRSPAEAELHWIECNGRWGGVSIPMTLANRLTGDWQSHPFVVIQRESKPMEASTIGQAIDRLGPRLFRPGVNAGGIVLLSPRIMAEARGLHFMAIGRDVAEADAMAAEAAAILTGRTR